MAISLFRFKFIPINLLSNEGQEHNKLFVSYSEVIPAIFINKLIIIFYYYYIINNIFKLHFILLQSIANAPTKLHAW